MKYIFRELKNPTKKDLEFFYDGASYRVLAEKSDIFPDFLAEQGAKILADREWNNPLDLVGYNTLKNSYLGAVKNEASVVVKPTLTEEIAMEKEQIKEVEKEFEDLEEKSEESSERDLLKEDARKKGIEFPSNIPTKKLKELLYV